MLNYFSSKKKCSERAQILKPIVFRSECILPYLDVEMKKNLTLTSGLSSDIL